MKLLGSSVERRQLNCTILFLSLAILWKTCDGSTGDRSEVYRKCVFACTQHNCSADYIAQFYERQYFFNKLLFWNCEDECRYECMWKTVRIFLSIQRSVPQFYGKWPFTRILGFQEPASVIASVLNALVLYFAWKNFKSRVPQTAPMYYVVCGMAVVGINAWIWSTAFHSRDNAVTEKLDYFCALSLVLYSFFTACIRFMGTNSIVKTSCAAICLAFFVYHVHYLSFVSFDYGYHMKVNISVGLLNSGGWLMWCYLNRKLRYSWKCFITIVCIDTLLLLELGDFPPFFWTFDAHSLWHFGTIPLPLLWYSFLADDCLHQLREKYRLLEKLKHI